MSRAILKMLLARTIQHEPTDTELSDFLAHCRELAGDSERLYIPRAGPDAEKANSARQLRECGMSIRKIAKVLDMSKSQVHRALSQNPDFFVDSNS